MSAELTKVMEEGIGLHRASVLTKCAHVRQITYLGSASEKNDRFQSAEMDTKQSNCSKFCPPLEALTSINGCGRTTCTARQLMLARQAQGT